MMELLLPRYTKRSDELVRDLELAQQDGRLEEALLGIFMGHEMDMLCIWSARFFLRGLSVEFYKRNPCMLPFRIIIDCMSGNLEEIDNWLSLFGRDFSEIDIASCTPIDFTQIMLEIVIPSYTTDEILKRIRFITSYLSDAFGGGLALTACRPSVINGFRDFTELFPDILEKKYNIERDIYLLYGKSGKGVYEVALAEWKYETDDIFDALLLIAGTIPSLDNADDVRCLVAAYVLQMRILVLNGQSKYNNDIFERILEKVYTKGYEEMEMCLSASKCLFDCYSGNTKEVENWLENNAPDENKEFFTMDMYAYMIKMRCYLQTGKYMMTSLLAKKLLEILKQSYRPHDECECYIMSAIACYKAGQKKYALEEFEKALEIGIPHGYYRVFADEGQMMINLLQLYKNHRMQDPADEIPYDKRLLNKIKNSALEIARRFPSYLETAMDTYNELTKMEKEVLHLMSEGLSNDSIADYLGKKTGTIKYHTAGIYRKLNVENRQQAINKARSLGVL